MLCPAETARRSTGGFFFLFSKIYEEWNLRLLKLVLNFTAGKNYSTFTNHSKVSVFSSIKKNYGVNRRILIYLSISTWTKQEFLPDFEEIVVTWQSHHIQNRSGIYLNAFLKIAVLNSSSFLTLTSQSFLAQISVSRVYALRRFQCPRDFQDRSPDCFKTLLEELWVYFCRYFYYNI
jgi:hypothetical protein